MHFIHNVSERLPPLIVLCTCYVTFGAMAFFYILKANVSHTDFYFVGKRATVAGEFCRRPPGARVTAYHSSHTSR